MKELENGYFFENDTIKIFITKKSLDAKNINDLKRELNLLGFKSENLQFVKQVHGNEVQIIKDNVNCNENEKDALITNLPNIPLLIFTADCVPIIFFDNIQKVIGLAHAGWQGTYKKIAIEICNKMKEYYNCLPENIHVLIGPHISINNYEVSKDLIDKFSSLEIKDYYLVKDYSYYLNLFKINSVLLERVGVYSNNIINLDMCTVRDNNNFYSYRKDKKTTKRIGTIIELK